ncbi:MAG: glucan biosynthesis protein, partial [Citrobacter sp.]
MNRRRFIKGSMAMAAVCGTSGIASLFSRAAYAAESDIADGKTVRFDFSVLQSMAHDLAQKPWGGAPRALPDTLAKLTPQAYNSIQYDAEQSLWNNVENRQLDAQFFHVGMGFRRRVRMFSVDDSTHMAREIHFRPELFKYNDAGVDTKQLEGQTDLGFAGFRVFKAPELARRDVVSFLGASYFRVLGAGQVYGLSARGLAIDTALPSGEEFPRFREFWIERPKPTDKRLTIYALLDSPRATGAYRFVIMPGRDTVVDVQSKVYLRDKVGKLGVAPLTSMFLFGPNQPSPATNYRPELHDSNGLSIHAGNGEWIWRPLNNPKHLAVSSFAMENPQGFGLLQRGRQFSRFEDIEDRYDLRPSAWVTPKGDWGKGKIELVEIPTNDETNDNIVAYWTPDQLPEAGKEMNFKYTLTFTRDEDKLHAPESAWVQQTRRSTGDVKQSNLIRQPDGTIAFMVDFAGTDMKKLPQDTPVTAQTSIGDNGEIVESTVNYNPVTKGWRLMLRVKVKDAKKTTEMRAALVNADQTLS